jgi:hypothetical protein
VEYLMNRIITAKCKGPQKILKDPKNFLFSVKLQLLYSMHLLPDHIYGNIQRLNSCRNLLTHNLYFDEERIDRSYYSEEGKLVSMRIRKRIPSARKYLRMLAYVTVDRLAKHINTGLGLSRVYRKAIRYRSPSYTKGQIATIKD